MPNPQSTTAADIYALAMGRQNKGPDACHWCGSMCQRSHPHDEPPPAAGFRRITTALRPGNRFVCVACLLWRRLKLTARFLDDTFRDGQTPVRHSWLVTADEARAVRTIDGPLLYPILLKPPRRFFLALATPGNDNLLQLAVANDLAGEVRADTHLTFTLNGVPHSWTVYDLREGLKNSEGEGSGVRVLMQTFGAWVPPQPERRDKGKGSLGGRPSTEPDVRALEPKTVVLISGV